MVAVTAVGLFEAKSQAMWLLPLVGGATVGVAVGSIVEIPRIRDRRLETREHLCLTVTFNHDIVDGDPAARFLKRYSELLAAAICSMVKRTRLPNDDVRRRCLYL